MYLYADYGLISKYHSSFWGNHKPGEHTGFDYRSKPVRSWLMIPVTTAAPHTVSAQTLIFAQLYAVFSLGRVSQNGISTCLAPKLSVFPMLKMSERPGTCFAEVLALC